jgi:hypothetical protein
MVVPERRNCRLGFMVSPANDRLPRKAALFSLSIGTVASGHARGVFFRIGSIDQLHLKQKKTIKPKEFVNYRRRSGLRPLRKVTRRGSLQAFRVRVKHISEKV